MANQKLLKISPNNHMLFIAAFETKNITIHLLLSIMYTTTNTVYGIITGSVCSLLFHFRTPVSP